MNADDTAVIADMGDALDTKRLDWLGTGHKGHDVTICAPGNHGGSILNWLLVLDTWGRDCGSPEYEAATLRECIDAAIAAEKSP